MAPRRRIIVIFWKSTTQTFNTRKTQPIFSLSKSRQIPSIDFTNINIKTCKSSQEKDQMQFSSQDIFEGINSLRANPHSATLKIKEQLNRFQSNSSYRNKQGVRVRTMSGKSAWQDAILSLERQKFKEGLAWNESLAMAAEQCKNVLAQQPDAKVSPLQAIKPLLSYEGLITFQWSECIVESDMSQLLAALIICDGNQEQSTRTAVFHPKYKELGCALQYNGKKLIIYMLFAESATLAQGVSQKSNNVQQPTGGSMPQEAQQIINPMENQYQSSPMANQSEYQVSQNSSGLMGQNRSGFSARDLEGIRSYEGQKAVLRRIKKTQTRFENGRKYKVTATLVVFEDGTEEETIEDQLIG